MAIIALTTTRSMVVDLLELDGIFEDSKDGSDWRQGHGLRMGGCCGEGIKSCIGG